MRPWTAYRATAFYLAVWYAFLATLGVVLLIALNDVGPASAFLIAANSALLFALLAHAPGGPPGRPAHHTRAVLAHIAARGRARRDDTGRLMARRALEETWLRFAKGAAAVAILFSGLAYASNCQRDARGPQRSASTAMAQIDSGEYSWTGYRSARLLPTN